MIKDLLQCDHSGRMSGDKRREQILETAVSLFSQRGFRGTTTKEIARAAGVSEAMVFRHFSTKDDLYAAILESKSCQGEPHLPWNDNGDLAKSIEEKDDEGVFYHIALHALNKHHSDIGFLRLLFYSALEERALADRFFNDFVTRIYDFVGNYIKQRQLDGVFREIEPKIAVRALLGMLIHHSLNNILWDKDRTILNVTNEEAAKNFSEILLRGIKR